MPSRNVNKVDIAESFYHVYARGGNKQKIFLDTQDYMYFLQLFQRYLGLEPAQSKTGVPYPHYRGGVDLVAYCLMQNHFHLLLYQVRESQMRGLMQSVMTSYSRYFNLRYKRTGPVFESRYKAACIKVDAYLQHITRYIHLNPRHWEHYRHSSLRYYLGNQPPEWLEPRRATSLYDGSEDYREFVADYEANKRMLDELKHELADW